MAEKKKCPVCGKVTETMCQHHTMEEIQEALKKKKNAK